MFVSNKHSSLFSAVDTENKVYNLDTTLISFTTFLLNLKLFQSSHTFLVVLDLGLDAVVVAVAVVAAAAAVAVAVVNSTSLL
jgi:hypothetical protein